MASSRRPGSAPTIVHVAEAAGVSIKTVSRVLNNEPGVLEKTRHQVLKVVADMKYRPKLSARSLAGARSYLICLLYYDFSAAFVAGVQAGATRRCREAGYHLVVEALHNDAPDIGAQVERMVSTLRPDGMILTPPLCDNAKVLAALRESQTPCVLMSPGRISRSQPSVHMDDVHAAEEVTSLLIGLGHRRIAFVKGAIDQPVSALRYKGFTRAMAAHGLEVVPKLVCQGDFTFPSGIQAAHQLLEGGERPSAVFASNDDMALGVLAAALRLGLQVPANLSIAGFDDAAACKLVWPPLTTVRQPVDEMARVAVDMLIGPQRGADGTHAVAEADAALQRVLPYELLVRESTARPRRTNSPAAQVATVDQGAPGAS